MTTADPVAVAIARYQAAHAFFAECLDKVQEIDKRRSRLAEKAAKLDAYDEREELERVGGEADCAAARALARTVPQTAAQALAVLTFLRERDEAGDDWSMIYSDDDGGEGYLYADVLASLETFLRAWTDGGAA